MVENIYQKVKILYLKYKKIELKFSIFFQQIFLSKIVEYSKINISFLFFDNNQMNPGKTYTLREMIARTEDEIKKCFSQAHCNNKVILLGSTGSGKTTVSCIMSGAKVKVVPIRNIDVKFDFKGINEGGTSETTIPNIMVDQKNDILYGDCPGFEDSEGIEQEIINAFAVNYLLTMFEGNQNNVKILLVIGADEIKTNRSKSILKNLERIEEMFPNKAQLQKGIGILFTKTNPEKPKIDYIDELNERAKPVVRKWCEFFRNNEEKIFTMPEITRADVGKDYEYEYQKDLINFLLKDQMINPKHFISLGEAAEDKLEKELDARQDMVEDILNLIFETIYGLINKINTTQEVDEWIQILSKIERIKIQNTKELKNVLLENLPKKYLSLFSNYFISLEDFEAFEFFVCQALNIRSCEKIQKMLTAKINDAKKQINLINHYIQTDELRRKDLENLKILLSKQEQMTTNFQTQFEEAKNESENMKKQIQSIVEENDKKLKQISEENDEKIKKMKEKMSSYENSGYLKRFRPSWIRSQLDHQQVYINDDENVGLFGKLTEIFKGNLHENGIIQITSNSINGDIFKPENVLNYDSDNTYANNNDLNSFLIFDLIDQKIQIQSYIIKSPSYKDHDPFYLKSWVLEVSHDKNIWETIDSRSNDNALNGPNVVCVFNLPNITNDYYRYIRLRQTGCAWTDQKCPYIFGIKYIDFYGRIVKLQ